MYLKHPEQSSMPLVSRLYLEIKFQLHNPKQIRADKLEEIPIHHSCQEIACEPDVASYVAKLADDWRVDGRRVVVDLYRHQYYRRAVLAVAKYTGQDWCRLHAVELHTVWRMLRKK
jgi:hypothetical protein